MCYSSETLDRCPSFPPAEPCPQHLLRVSLADHVADLQDGFPVCLQQELARGLICSERTPGAAVSRAAAAAPLRHRRCREAAGVALPRGSG